MLTGIGRSRGVLLDTHIWIALQSGAVTLSKPALDAIAFAHPLAVCLCPIDLCLGNRNAHSA